MVNGKMLDISALEGWLWEAACVIRGPVDAPKYKDYILPLIFLKRLSDVFEDELADLGARAKLVDKDHKLVRFYIPPDARWPAVQKRTTGLGEYLTDAVRAVARENPKLAGVVDTKDSTKRPPGSASSRMIPYAH
jgi:type I restriction enzyme M protein